MKDGSAQAQQLNSRWAIGSGFNRMDGKWLGFTTPTHPSMSNTCITRLLSEEELKNSVFFLPRVGNFVANP
jgi:hypothetical protein